MGKLLSIETGYGCNSRCGFCPQVAYRQETGVEVDLSGEEIRAKIRWGREQGYAQIGFSGGEVTIRPDAIDLLRYAREQGFERIGLTTNGRMLAYPAYAKALIDAGVSAVNFSIHGHTAQLHDSLTHSPGSFEQAMQGIDYLRAAAAQAGRKIDLMSMSLATPQNVEHFPDIVRMFGQKGFKLHMLQPFIVNEDTLELSGRYFVEYARIEAALRAAAEVAREHGGKLKLYNIPPCLVRDIADSFDAQDYAFDVFSRHETEAADEANIVKWGFYRIPECQGCEDAWICPGFRAEQHPQAPRIAEARTHFDAGAGPVLVAGTELLSEPDFRALIAEAKAAGRGPVAVVTGGSHRLSKRLYAIAADAGAEEIVFAAHLRDPAAADPRTRERGNALKLRRGVALAREVAELRPLKLSVAFAAQDLLAPGAEEELLALHREGVERFYVGISYAHQDVDEEAKTLREERLDAGLARLWKFAESGVELVFADHPPPEGYPRAEAAREALAARFPRVEGAQLLPRTQLASPDAYWIIWSIPHWALVPIRPPEGERAGPSEV